MTKEIAFLFMLLGIGYFLAGFKRQHLIRKILKEEKKTIKIASTTKELEISQAKANTAMRFNYF